MTKTRFRQIILEALSLCDRNRKEIDELLKDYGISHNYPQNTFNKLKAMVDLGLISCETHKGRIHNIYSITEKGQRFLRNGKLPAFIEKMKQPDGNLYQTTDPYVCTNDKGTITLDGEFTYNELKEIVKYLKNRGK